MARAYFSCSSCGTRVEVSGHNRRDADRVAAWKEKNEEVCSDCWKKRQDAEHSAAASINAGAGLPELTGSEKQVLWAEGIRAQKIATLDVLLAGQSAPAGYYWEQWEVDELLADPRCLTAAEAIRTATNAVWWIDNRNERIIRLLAAQIAAMDMPAPPEISEFIAGAEIAATAEATLLPESPLTATVAEIRATVDVVEIKFPEKRDDFREIVKERGFLWAKDRWSRKINISINGTPADRAAEMGHRLLAAGFAVRIFDAAIRATAIVGNYSPEQTRWVMARNAGAYIGWFALIWKRPDDLYQAAMRITRARYDSPSVVVPATQFEEVLDFAGRYDFAVSPGASRLIDQQRAIRDGAQRVFIAPTADSPPMKGQAKPGKLEIPDVVEVDHDLRD